MSSPTEPSAPDAPPTGSEPPGVPAPHRPVLERPHPLTPLVRGWIVLVAGIFGFSQNITDIMSGRSELPPWWVLVGLLLLVAVAAGLAGLASWWFTRFVIDDDEVRVETGWLQRRSRRVAFDRIQSVDVDQPLAARLLGLAELRIEAGAGESATRLRYLQRTRAYTLRDYLLQRAVGQRATVADVGQGPQAGALVDASAADRVLLAMSPARIVGAFLLSAELWWSVVLGVVVVGVGRGLGVEVISLAALFPLALGLVSAISRRLVHQYNFRLLRTPLGGLRVTAGLTRLGSQSLPLDRIQGVRISQSLLWRIPGWWQADIDMVGVSAGNEDGEDRRESTVLPAGTTGELGFVLAQVLPGIDLGAVQLHRVPARVRWIRWFDQQTLRWGATPQAAIADSGLLVRHGEIVPLHKFQSVRLTQGPLQRLLRVASVHLDTTPGPVHHVARHLPVEQARPYAEQLLAWGSAARRSGSGVRTPVGPSAGPPAGPRTRPPGTGDVDTRSR
ncbi:putative membrane protein [Raineyella antarctica]|uniref:Putative membrane protein n=1 Tax=Raineyella antarctica TaxID=1577474 RepID=A0A1G6GF97_9ACTN|nr:PH domain-containing protein [Raineyella antarctica]SDB80667.1 putative membrane protein [Raineyella antarctica]